MPRLGFDRVPFVLPPIRMAMDSAMHRSPITFDGALAAPVALDAEITFDEPDEEPGIPMSQAFKNFDRIKR
jgi:hypothetical protein